VVSDHPQKKRIVAQGRRIPAGLEPKPPTFGCALPPLPVLVLMHNAVLSPTAPATLAVVDEDGEAVGFPPKTIVDKKEVVDKFGPHPRLQMDAHISFPETCLAHLHNRFHRGTCLELPT